MRIAIEFRGASERCGRQDVPQSPAAIAVDRARSANEFVGVAVHHGDLAEEKDRKTKESRLGWAAGADTGCFIVRDATPKRTER
jgi:hypothetical protein